MTANGSDTSYMGCALLLRLTFGLPPRSLDNIPYTYLTHIKIDFDIRLDSNSIPVFSFVQYVSSYPIYFGIRIIYIKGTTVGRPS